MKFLILPLLALVSSARAADLAGDFKGPLGLQLYTLRESFKTNVPATLDKVKAMGFTEIEGGGDYGLGIEKFNAMLQERGLKMASAGFGYEAMTKDIAAAVRRAQAFGVKFVMCAWIPHKESGFTEADVHRAAADFNFALSLTMDSPAFVMMEGTTCHVLPLSVDRATPLSFGSAEKNAQTTPPLIAREFTMFPAKPAVPVQVTPLSVDLKMFNEVGQSAFTAANKLAPETVISLIEVRSMPAFAATQLRPLSVDL